MKEIDNAPTSNQQPEVVDKYANQGVLPDVLAVPDDYFTNPTGQPNTSFVLSPLHDTIAQQIGCMNKKILLKYSILKRNRRVHNELVKIKRGTVLLYRAKDTLNRALYHADTVRQGNKPTYQLLVSFKDLQDNKMYNAVATINTAPTENSNYIEVVDWFIKRNM